MGSNNTEGILKIDFLSHFHPDTSIRSLGSADMQCLPTTFDLLLWNMQKCRGKAWQTDFLQLIHGRHLLLLQEAALSAVNLEIFDKHEEFLWTMARSYTRLASGRETGVKTGSRCNPLQAKSYRSPSFEPFARTHKMMLQSSYSISGCAHNLMVLNLHAINFSRIGNYKEHLSQMFSAAKIHHGPLILAGDFNTWSGRRYDHLKQACQELGLREAEIARRSRARHLYRHLDHLFYRGLKLEEVTLVDKVSSSDHFPIAARFSAI